MTEQRKQKLKRQLQEARCRLCQLNYEFARPLKDMHYVATKDVSRISTNGKCIYFDPDWLQKLGHRELDFILSHQLMHIALGHIDRPKYYMGDRFHLACDIVANSYLGDLGWEYEKLPHIGKIYHETFFPKTEGKFLTAQKALTYIPFDPAVMKSGVKRNYMIDSEIWWERKEDSGENGEIILSPKDEEPEDLQGDEDNRGGHFKVSKEIFYKKPMKSREDRTSEKKKQLGSWDKKVINQLQSIRNNEQQNAKEGLEEDFRERIWQRVNTVQLNWKKLLNSFLQEEVCDYSFAPPDRRMQETEFFLPDYNVMKEKPKEVIFMVDTSGSIDDDTLSNVYSEICNALTQFNGGLIGVLCFFDVKVHTPIYFSGIDDLLKIKPCGGGGTSYARVFDYIESFFTGDRIAEVVIFTDGEAEFPEETVANNIPVLWLFTNRGVRPPWGKYAYIDSCREI